jgi:AcrR family transcriptional regulator
MEQAKKECILVAAAKAFARFGLKKASVEEIAREAGVGKGTIYLAAESKEDLFYQSVHREVRAWTGELAKLIDPRVPADELLRRTAIAGLNYLQDRPLVRDLLFGTHDLVMPEWQDRLEALRELGRANVREILTLGVRQGRFRGDLDIEEVAKILQDMALSTYVFHNRDAADRVERLQRRLETGFELVMNGLRKQAAEAAARGNKDEAA